MEVSCNMTANMKNFEASSLLPGHIARSFGSAERMLLSLWTGHMLQKANEGGVKCCEKAGNWKIRTRKWDDAITRRFRAVEQCGHSHALVWGAQT